MAKITYAHARDHAVVVFDGELDWDAARELVESLDTMVGDYFYPMVELVVSSPGGKIGALQYVLDRLEQLERQGVQVRTRVLSSAGSAAAIIVALGHERVAEPDAILSFHCAQLSGTSEINAQSTAAIHSVLNELDGRMVGRLVGRVLATSDAKRPPHQAERSDRRVLELVAGSLGRSGRRKLPRKVRGLARVVGEFVDRAVRDEDREALSRLYRRLFAIEATVSARLAVTLRLLDRIGCEPAGATVRGDDEGLTVPEWHVLYPPDGTVPRQALCRHALILGETGSGKTASCILPVVAAMARTPRNRLGGALIVDPKRELGRTLRDLAPERVHEIQADRVVLQIMSGPRWSLEDDLGSGRWLSAARRVLCRAASLVPSSPARVLMDHRVGDANAEFFDREGSSLALMVLAFVLMLTDRRTPEPEQWIDDVEAFAWADDFLARARGRPGERGPNAFALAAWCLEGPLLSCPPPRRSTVLVSGDDAQSPAVGWLFARVAQAALASVCREPGEGWDLCERVLGYWSAMVEVGRQYAGVRAVASVICSDFATPSIAFTLYLGCEPGYRAAREDGNGIDFARLVAADGPGTLVLFEPARDGLDALIAVSLKALFFESVLDDPDRASGGTDLPLVGYVADEFHRFVTSDVVHGEQSFLDSCRSYSACCVLACQSVASLEHALAHGGGSAEQNRSAVSVLLSNTATKFFFRNTDPHTAERVGELSPYRPGLAGVVRVRPVSTLAAGEAYIALSDGRFERPQLQPFVGATPGPEKAPARPVALLEGPDQEGGRG